MSGGIVIAGQGSPGRIDLFRRSMWSGLSGFAPLLLLLSCSSGTSSAAAGGCVAPSAAFTSSPEAPLSSQTVFFTDASTGSPTAWSWTFGDSTTSFLQNPGHIFSTAGTFTVGLTVTNTYGSSAVSRTLSVSQGSFSLTSEVGLDGGNLPTDYTCDGTGATPALSWSNPNMSASSTCAKTWTGSPPLRTGRA